MGSVMEHDEVRQSIDTTKPLPWSIAEYIMGNKWQVTRGNSQSPTNARAQFPCCPIGACQGPVTEYPEKVTDVKALRNNLQEGDTGRISCPRY